MVTVAVFLELQGGMHEKELTALTDMAGMPLRCGQMRVSHPGSKFGVIWLAAGRPAAHLRVSQNLTLRSLPAIVASLSGWLGCHVRLVTPSLCPRSSASCLICTPGSSKALLPGSAAPCTATPSALVHSRCSGRRRE